MSTAPPPAPRSWLHLDAVWRELDLLYLSHHWNCTHCRAAAQGHSDRCETGQRLHDNYLVALASTT